MTLSCAAGPRRVVAVDRPAKLERLFADYWEDQLADSPVFATRIGDRRYDDRLRDLSEQAYRGRYERARGFLARASEIDEASLPDDDRGDLEILRRTLQLAVAGEPLQAFDGEHWLMPLNQIGGFHLDLLRVPDAQPFATAADYAAYVRRLGAFPAQVDAVIANLRKGLAMGVVSPRTVVEKVLPQLEAAAVRDATKSALFAPAQRIPETIAAAERPAISKAVERVILEAVSPAYARLLAFLRAEYLPRANPTTSWAALPQGPERYAYAIEASTTRKLSIDDLIALGMRQLEVAEAARVENLRKLGFTGKPVDFNRALQEDRGQRLFDAAAVERIIRESLARIEPRVPKLFKDVPSGSYQLRPVEADRAATFPAGQLVAGDDEGLRPSTFFYNLHGVATEGIRKFLLPDLAFHEVIPGHHLQRLFAHAKGRPAFRMHDGNSAYDEGWGAYAERLADEVGAYPDAFSRNFWLSSEVYLGVSLVAEAGTQGKGWSREQALEFIHRYLPMPAEKFEQVRARWAAMPAQAMSYGVGAMTICELRARAEEQLGPAFDLPEFHSVVLGRGNVPLDVLASSVEGWIARKRGAARR